jgi:hypothetical protein
MTIPNLYVSKSNFMGFYSRQLILLHSRDTPMHYPDAESAMATCMPRMASSLAYLDLSGTNLCGFLLPEPVQHRLGHGGGSGSGCGAQQQNARYPGVF